MYFKYIVLVFILCLCSFTSIAEADVEYFRSDAFKEKNLPLSEAVRIGNLVFVSGNLGIDFSKKELGLVPGGIVAETKQTMANIEKALITSGSSLDQLIKCTVYLSNMEEWPQLNRIWPSFFKENYPTRTAIEVARLWRGAAVEITCTGYVD
ncbi:MAG: RidA family protein [Gammaproteobacteria bacterium]|nr:RidA family protein [Gammaproteobacteria bacterium]